jgi:hypothetical protein
MLSRTFALWLMTLIVLPFTAPFAAYEELASQSNSHVRSLTDTTTSHALPVARAASRMRVKVAVSTACKSVGLMLSLNHEPVGRATASFRLVSTPLSPPLRI